MRLFLGLDIPLSLKLHIHDYLAPLQNSPKGWENFLDYHQTLLFIGEADEVQKDLIQKKLADLYFNSFELVTNGFHFFPRRIMYLAFKPSAKVMQLKSLIDEAFSQWKQDHQKPFLPHVTVKRWQRYEYDKLAHGLKSREFKDERFIVNKIALFKSEKDSQNRKYHIIEEVLLDSETSSFVP